MGRKTLVRLTLVNPNATDELWLSPWALAWVTQQTKETAVVGLLDGSAHRVHEKAEDVARMFDEALDG